MGRPTRRVPSRREPDGMAGAMRKMAVYLGLVEDEADLYDEYGYEEDETTRADVRPEPRTATRTLQPVRDEKLQAPVTTAVRPAAPRLEPDLDSYRITTLHPRNYNY